MRLAALGLLLVGCGPVMLGDESALDAGTKHRDAASEALAPQEDAGMVAIQDAGQPPVVGVRVKPTDCGHCFDLQAVGAGGLAPYAFVWEDGAVGADRQICVGSSDIAFSVLALDAKGARSALQTFQLQAPDSDAACPDAMPPTAAAPPPLLCLKNLSLEGTPNVNLGQPNAFDAPPWIACTNASMPSNVPNYPSIGNESVAVVMNASVPKPTDGITYLALGEGQHVSQPFCSAVQSSNSFSLEFDLAQIDYGQGSGAQAEKAFLEIWGGLSVDCSQRELLWASPAVSVGWLRYCATFYPHSFMDQITLRANSDMTQASPIYLAVDNLKPVVSCP